MKDGRVLRFAYSTINWGQEPDVAAMLATIAEAGWLAVELFDHPLSWLGPHTRLADQLRVAGLQTATAFGTIAVPTNARHLARHQRQIDYLAALGGEVYGLVGGNRLRWRPPAAAEYADLARFCDDLARYGADHGVTVAYHPHVACTVETEEEIDRLLDATRDLQLCLDASHIALVGEDPIAHIRKYRTRTSYIHLKDWARGKFVEVGEGSLGIDFAAILQELTDATFAGWVVVEQSRSDVSPAASAEANAAAIRRLGYAPDAIGAER